MESALHEDTCATQFLGFEDFILDRLVIEDVGLGMFEIAVESTELASCDTDIGIINIAIDDIGDNGFGV